ncbi:MAG: hypothetical protein FJW95_11305 [Actinobacteria bacterium]|nr:hypothetical protein [Actinomycetota bacterium]
MARSPDPPLPRAGVPRVGSTKALFDDGPIPYTFTNPEDRSQTVEGVVTVDDLVEFIYSNQGSLGGNGILPSFLQAMVEGGPEAAAEVLGQKKGSALLISRTATKNPIAYAMHSAMVCSDDPVRSADDVKTDGVGRYATLFGQIAAKEYVELCSLVNVRALPDSTDVDVTTDVPVLLLSGTLDVQTPEFRTREVADALPNAEMVVFPGRSHVQIAGANLCASSIMTQFVLDPTADLKTRCVKKTQAVPFAPPQDAGAKSERN